MKKLTISSVYVNGIQIYLHLAKIASALDAKI